MLDAKARAKSSQAFYVTRFVRNRTEKISPATDRAGDRVPGKQGGHRWFEGVIHFVLRCCAAISVVTTLGIVIILVSNSIPFFAEVSVIEFLTGTKWAPHV